MCHAFLMRVMHRVTHLEKQPHPRPQRQFLIIAEPRDRHASGQFRDQERLPVLRHATGIKFRDAWVIQQGERWLQRRMPQQKIVRVGVHDLHRHTMRS